MLHSSNLIIVDCFETLKKSANLLISLQLACSSLIPNSSATLTNICFGISILGAIPTAWFSRISSSLENILPDLPDTYKTLRGEEEQVVA